MITNNLIMTCKPFCKPLVVLTFFLFITCCAKGGSYEDGWLEDSVGDSSDFVWWIDMSYDQRLEFGIGSRDGWHLSQEAHPDLSCIIRNDCGGCAPLEGVPGAECDSCGGIWECEGTEAVKCVGGCDTIGCSDGEREGFTDVEMFPEIAGCAGGWTVPGLIVPDSGGVVEPACGRLSGDDSFNPSGLDCSAADLCANGWRLCSSPRDVADRTKGWDKGCGTDSDWPPGSFFAAAVSGTGSNECMFGVNDIFGCGSVGARADTETCYPLNKYSDDFCDALPSRWDCGEGSLTTNLHEARDVTKDGPEGGGVLCCKDRR